MSESESRGLWWRSGRPSVRVTSEFDSESSAVMHKLSCKLLNGIAKLKVSSVQNEVFNAGVEVRELDLATKHLSVHYDLQERNALLRASVEPTPQLHLSAVHDLHAGQALLSLTALPFPSNPTYALELASPIPTTAALPLPSKASLKFPLGEVTLAEAAAADEDEESAAASSFSVSGTLKAQALRGLCSAQYSGEQRDVKLRYAFKDEQVAFIPSLSLPSNAVSFAFKRRFSPSHKLSYWYNLDVNNWSAVYKQTYGKDLKLKAGYDSEVRLGWASIWVGDENGKAKAAPLKMKVQLMVQVPQDDIKSSALMFRVKKRWDI